MNISKREWLFLAGALVVSAVLTALLKKAVAVGLEIIPGLAILFIIFSKKRS